MDEIKWLEVAINTTPERLDEITAKLTAAGMTGLVIEDEAEFQQFLEQNRQYWDYVDQELMERMRGVTRVKFYVTDDADGRTQLERYTRGLECEYTTRTLVDNDWAYSWQKYYKPLSIGERLYVVPQWEREEPVPQGRVPFYLNPGLTFGTGSHASTQLCLEGVEAHTREGDRVLDLGCGSGILSIAALVLGAERASAVDIDPKAVDVAYENAALNGIGKDRYTVRGGCAHRPGSGGRTGPRALPAGAGQHRGRCDHPPGAPGARPAGRGRGVSLLRHHRQPGPRGGGGPGPQRPAGDPEAGAERLGCSGGSPGLKRKVS